MAQTISRDLKLLYTPRKTGHTIETPTAVGRAVHILSHRVLSGSLSDWVIMFVPITNLIPAGALELWTLNYTKFA